MARSPRGARPGGPLRRLEWLAEAAALNVCAAAIGRASPRARLAIGSACGTAFWAVDSRHRRAAQRNIALAYGDTLSSGQVDALVLASMRHFARVAVETLSFRDGEDRVGSIGVEGLDYLREARAKGRGVIGFQGHFGHWELARFTLGYHGLPTMGIARPMDNPYLDRRLSQLRARGGNDLIAQRGGVAAALKCLRDGSIVGIMIDQRPERSGVAVPFLGHQAFAAGSLAVLALRTGAPIVPGFGFLDPDGSWRVVVEPEVPVVRTGDLRADTQRIMTDCTAVLERWIRRYPEQWLWTHARLKA
jgi:KDO2-lipid IV(A) lauroyltransferase